MTRPKTRWCEDCRWFKWVEGAFGVTCIRGHIPRFYVVTKWDEYGYKRRCSDYKIGDHVGSVTPT